MSLETLSVLVGILFVLSIAVSWLRQNTLFTTSVLFLGVWSLVLLAQYYQNIHVGYDYIPEDSYRVLALGIVSLTLGCLGAQLLLGRSRSTTDELQAANCDLPRFVRKLFPFVFLLVFIPGLGAFFSQGGGVSFALENLQDIRVAHVWGESQSVFFRLANYAVNVALATSVLLAVADSQTRTVSIGRLALLILAVLPFSLSKGARVEFVQVALYYAAASFVLLSLRPASPQARDSARRFVRTILKKFPLVLAFLLAFFAIIGIARSPHRFQELSSMLDFVLAPVTGYLAASVYSVGPLTLWISEHIGFTFGDRYFDFFHRLLGLLGVEVVAGKETVRSAWSELGSIAYTPGTFVRHLVSDFGLRAFPYVAFAIGFGSTLAVLRMPAKSLLAIGFLTLIVFDLGYSFHDVGLFTVRNFYILIVLFVIAQAFELYRRRRARARREFWPATPPGWGR